MMQTTPGGALEPGESYKDAASRELTEEAGIVADIGEEIAQRDVVFAMPDGEKVFANERYFLVRVADDGIDRSGQDPLEAKFMKQHGWWSLAELREKEDAVSVARQVMGKTNPSDAGPGTIRGDFGLEIGRNIIHGADSLASAEREIAIYFKPEEILDWQRIDEAWLYE